MLWAATHPVRPVPIGTRRTSAEGSETPRNSAAEGDRLAHARGVVDAVDAGGVRGEEAADLGHDGLADLRRIVEAVQPGGQVLDGVQARGEVADARVQAGVLEGDGDLVGEALDEVQLGRRPAVRSVAWYSAEQPERLVAVHDRDEADRLEALVVVGARRAPVSFRSQGGRRTSVRRSLDRPPARRRAAAPDVGDVARKVGSEAPVRCEPERVVAVLDGPQARLVGPEQRERVVEHVVEDPAEVAVACRRRLRAAGRPSRRATGAAGGVRAPPRPPRPARRRPSRPEPGARATIRPRPSGSPGSSEATAIVLHGARPTAPSRPRRVVPRRTRNLAAGARRER